MLGATTLEEFALALLIGLFAGAYSSIFIASPLLAVLKEREPRYRDLERSSRSGRRQRSAVDQTGAAPGGTGTAVLDRRDGRRPSSEPAAPTRRVTPVVTGADAVAGDRIIPPRPRKKGKKR